VPFGLISLRGGSAKGTVWECKITIILERKAEKAGLAYRKKDHGVCRVLCNEKTERRWAKRKAEGRKVKGEMGAEKEEGYQKDRSPWNWNTTR